MCFFVVPPALCCLACLLMAWGMYRKLDMGAFVATAASIPMPDAPDASVLDYEVVVGSGSWHPWKARVPIVDVDTHKVHISCTVRGTPWGNNSLLRCALGGGA